MGRLHRFVTQVNDVSPPLVTAQHVLGYNLPGGKTVMLSQLGNLGYVPCTSKCVNGGQAGFDPGDYGQPLTYAYNFTIDQRIKWNSVVDVAYVGSQTSQLSDDSEGIEGSNFAALADQNKTPIGSFFKPDPVTGVVSTNPENLGNNPNGTGTTPTGNVAADYHPYGYAYGTAAAAMIQSSGYTNYNGLQVAWIKTTGKLGFNLNGTWSKTLGTALQTNPFSVRANYGPTSTDRPFVFQCQSYYYMTPGKSISTSQAFVNQAFWEDGQSPEYQHGSLADTFPLRLGTACQTSVLAWRIPVCLQMRRPRASAAVSVVLLTLAPMLPSRFCLC